MSSLSPPWQQSLNADLVQRLNHPLTQPGVVSNRIANAIIERSSRLHNRLPLLAQQMQRWATVVDLETEQIPIVYAQPQNQESLHLETQQRNSGFSLPDNNQKQQPPLIQARRVQVSNDNITTDNSLTQPTVSDSFSSIRGARLSKYDAVAHSSVPHLFVNNQAEPAITTDAQLSLFPVVRVSAKPRLPQKQSIVNSKTPVRGKASDNERSQNNDFHHLQQNSTHPSEAPSIAENSVTHPHRTSQSLMGEISQVSPSNIQLKLDQSSAVDSQPFGIDSTSNTSLPLVNLTNSNVASNIAQGTVNSKTPVRGKASDNKRSQNNDFHHLQQNSTHPSEAPSIGENSVTHPHSTSQSLIGEISQVSPPDIQLKLDQSSAVHSQPFGIDSTFNTSLPFVNPTNSNISSNIAQETNNLVSNSQPNSLPIVQISLQSSSPQNVPTFKPADSYNSEQSQITQLNSIQDTLLIIQPNHVPNSIYPASDSAVTDSIHKNNQVSISLSTANEQTGATAVVDSHNFRSQHLKERAMSKPIPIVQVSLEASSPQLEPLILSQIPISQQKAATSANISSSYQINPNSNSQKVVFAHPESSTSQSLTTTSTSLNTQTTSQATVSKVNVSPQVDLDTLAEKVERKLMRKFIAESERRGHKKWR